MNLNNNIEDDYYKYIYDIKDPLKLEELYLKHETPILLCLARNEYCSHDLFIKLMKTNFINVKFFIIKNKNCPKEILEEVLINNDNDKNFLFLNAIENLNCPVYLLDKYSLDNSMDIDVDWSIVSNKNCPMFILKRIYNKKYEDCNLNNLIKIHNNWNLKDFE